MARPPPRWSDASTLGAPAAEVVGRLDATGNAGDLTGLVIGPGGGPCPFLFLGLGDGSPAAMGKAGAAVGRWVAPGRVLVSSALLGKPAEAVHAFIVGLLLGSYRWSQKRKEADGDEQPGEVRLLVAEPDRQADVRAAAAVVAGAVALARDLTNMHRGRGPVRVRRGGEHQGRNGLRDPVAAGLAGCG